MTFNKFVPCIVMNKIKYIIAVLFPLFLFINISQAQNFYSQVSSKKVQVGVPFEYSVVFTINTGNYTPPNFKDFDVISGPNQSSSYQNVNGVGSQQIIISYGLVAKREGKFTIGPSSTMSGSQKLETAAINVEVVKGNVNSNDNETQNTSKNSSGDLFIKTSANKNKCYVGEQITILQKVYSRSQIVGFQKFSQPTYEGFYSQAQESSSKGQVAIENIDGVSYYTFELFRTIAIANKSGKTILNSIQGDIVIRKQTTAKPKNIFEQFFGATSYEDIPINTKSKSIAIEILPLPEIGKPESFIGAVGDFNYKVDVTRNELKANDAFNLKMIITGNGNLKLINAPTLKLPDGFESYDPKITESNNSKMFDFLIIPRKEGVFTLNNLDFSYFDLNSKKYITKSAKIIKINVLAPAENSNEAKIFSSQTKIKETENDIRYIKKEDFFLTKSENEFFNSFTHILFLVLPLIALATGLLLRKNHIKNNSNIILVKERKAAKLAKKQLITAEKLMKEQKKDEFYTEVLMALTNYLGNKLNIPKAELSKESITKSLQLKNINHSTIQNLTNTIDTSEFAKYAPGSVSGNLQEVYNNTVELIANLEQQINKKI